MKSRNIYVTVEPTEATPVWFSRVLDGIKTACIQKRLSLVILSPDSIAFDTLEIQSRYVLVISSNIDWTGHAIHCLAKIGKTPILIGSNPERFGNDISGLYMNRYKLISSYVKYFITNGRFRIALVGLNPRSDNDLSKMDSFLRTGVAMNISLTAEDIFWLDEDFTNPVRDCLDSPEKYDAVICANDYVAIALMTEAGARGLSVPGDLFVAGMGHTGIGALCTPSLTTTSDDDFTEMGRQAFLLYESLSANAKLSKVSIAIDNHIIVRESTASVPVSIDEQELSPISVPNITAGRVSKELRNLEKMCNNSDDKDLEIIKFMLNGATNEQIEEQLYLAHSSLFYRQKRLYQLCNVSGKNDLLALVRKYLPDFPETCGRLHEEQAEG